MIEAHELIYTYPRATAPLLNRFSVSFQSGEVTALTGVNGCGKTTLSKLLVGILRPQSGCILINGEDIAGLNLFQIGQRVGYIWQNPNRQLFTPTASDEIAFGLKNKGLDDKAIQEISTQYLAMFHLLPLRDSHPLNMSLGEKQRLALASVLALGAPYLVLDEPTGGLDVRCRRILGTTLRSLIDKQKCSIILISHEREFISRYADREVVMTP